MRRDDTSGQRSGGRQGSREVRAGGNLIAIGALLAVASWCAASGQVAHGAEVEAEVTVRAKALRSTERVAPTAQATEIDTTRYAGELKSVADALGDTVGVTVRRYGGLGAFSTLSVRGFGANQVQVYFDGIPLSRAQNEVVNLADLPIDSLERVELYRGVTPVTFSAAGLGGVIHLVPRRDGGTRLQAGYGSFTTRKIAGTHSSHWKDFSYFAHLAYTGSAGNFRYRTDNDTPENPFDDRTVTRVHNSFDSVDLLLQLQKPMGSENELQVLHETFWKRTDLPGRGANPSLRAAADRLRVLDAVRIRADEWPRAETSSGVLLYSAVDRSSFRDPLGELGALQQDRSDTSWTLGADGSLIWYPFPWLALPSLVAASHEWFWPDNDALHAPQESPARRFRTAAALQPEFALLAERMTLVPGLRWEHVHDATARSVRTFGRVVPRLSEDRDLFTPSLGVAVRIVQGWTLRANIGRYQRAPNLLELFGLSGSVIGNPSLRPESAWNRDVGFRWQLPRVYLLDEGALEYSYFDNEVRDLVVFVQRSAAIFRPDNVGRARLRGHEIGVRLGWRQTVSAELNYTLQQPTNLSAVQGGVYFRKQLPGRPREELYGRLGARWHGVEAFYEINTLSGNYLDLANFQRVPSRALHAIGLSVRLHDRWQLVVQARNLTDNQVSDVGGFPLPGRAWFGTVNWSL